jgi:multidrug transporter EmrE-like cation transporter
MSTSAMANPQPAATHASAHRQRSVYMVIGCTLFAATAQVLLKFGAQHTMPPFAMGNSATWLPFLLGLLGNVPLVVGYSLHAANAMLLILALRGGELSLLFPIYALSYVWVSLLSMHFFHEYLNLWKSLGILLVIGGVALLGRASSQ